METTRPRRVSQGWGLIRVEGWGLGLWFGVLVLGVLI